MEGTVILSPGQESQLLAVNDSIIVKNSKSSVVKITNFGSFSTKYTPERVGRNPRTKQEYPIKERSKVVFKASDHTKKTLN